MIKNKTFLVARRELLENIRTKAFWIGILAMPIILTLSIAVPQMLEKTKDVRKFAVLDLSGKDLETLIDQEARLPDFDKLLRHLRKLAVQNDEDLETLSPYLRQVAGMLSKLPEDFIPEMARGFADFRTPGSRADRMMSSLSPEQQELVKSRAAEIDKNYGELKDYWQKISPEDAKKIASGLDRSRYQKITLDELGIGPEDDVKAELTARLRDQSIWAYFVIGSDPVSDAAGCLYVSFNKTDNDLKRWYKRNAEAVVRRMRFGARDIDKATMAQILAPLVFVHEQPAESGEGTTAVTQRARVESFVPLAFTYVLWMAIMSISQMLLTNTVEEKSNRIIEVLLSSVSPFQLMTGKIAGIASTGLTVLLAWVVFFFLFTKLAPGLFGLQIPDYMGEILRDPALLTSFVLYFLAGYLLFASILVGIGSVCNSLKEAQNLQMPVMMIMILPLLAIFPVTQDPNGTLAKMLSYIPFFTPFIMMNRAAGPPTTMEYVVTSVILLVAIVICVWAAAKIFRIGVLMTGKPPKLREILGWLRAPVGAVPTKGD